ncbi:hypothetical protein ACOMHN_009634 [Nucella lapillus]
MQEDCPISNPKKTPLGGGKRSRKQHCKKAIQARWKSKLADKQQAESTWTVGLADSDIQVHTVCGSGDAVEGCSRNQNLDGQDNLMQPEQRDNLSTARRKLGIMQEYVDAAGDTDQNKERCFLELGSLKKLFSSVTWPRCDASLNIAFGDKMGFSREIRIACEDCNFTKQQYSCSRQDGSSDITVGFDVNSSIVMCFNELGLGEAALQKFSAIMSIPGLPACVKES